MLDLDQKIGAYGFFQEAAHNPELATRMCSYILEGLHSSLDGWSEAQSEVIEDFLEDVTLGVVGELRQERREALGEHQ